LLPAAPLVAIEPTEPDPTAHRTLPFSKLNCPSTPQKKARQNRVSEFFTDQDPRKKGIITQTKFEQACTMAGFDLNRQQYSTLYQVFSVAGEADLVSYTQFIKYLDEANDSAVFPVGPTSQPNQRRYELTPEESQSVRLIVSLMHRQLQGAPACPHASATFPRTHAWYNPTIP